MFDLLVDVDYDDVTTPCATIGCSWPRSTLTGQDERTQPEQRGWSLLHPDWRTGACHVGGSGWVLLQVATGVAEDEGEFEQERLRCTFQPTVKRCTAKHGIKKERPAAPSFYSAGTSAYIFFSYGTLETKSIKRSQS